MTHVRELLQAGAANDPPAFGATAAMQRGTWLRWRRRIGIGTIVALATVAAISVAPGADRIVRDAHRITPAEQPTRNLPARTPQPTPPASGGESTDRSTSGAASAGRELPGPQVVADPRDLATCDPLITDATGDTSDATIDILHSGIEYDDDTTTLVLTHKMRNIALTPAAGEGPFYDLYFTWNDEDYVATAYITAAGEERFNVMRTSERPAVGTDSAVSPITEDNATGHIDPTSDTVELRLDLAAFDAGPGADLKRGSRFTDIRLVTNPKGSSWSMQEHPADVAAASCDYVVGG